MTRKPVRVKVSVAATALGVAVLLAGPMNTFGLTVPTTGDVSGTTTQVTSTVQGVVDTTEQTAATTVTNVESTVQTTVQTTTQAVAPQPAATAPAPSSVSTVTKQVTTRVAAPVTKQVSAGSRARTQGKPPAAPAQLAQKAGGASSEQVSVAAVAKRAQAVRTRHVTAPALTTTSPRVQDAPADCTVPALAMLPGGSELQALLNVVCDAAAGLDLPARIGLVHSDTGTPAALGDVHGDSARGKAGPVVARSSSLGTHPTAANGVRQATGGGSNALAAGHPTGAPIGAGAGRGAGLAYLSGARAADVSTRSGAGAGTHAAASSSGHHHHSFFSGQSRGTEILLAIIFANLAILGGIVLWRLAVRWVIPRFA
jgi:uncharacterized protein YoxC